MSLSCVSRLNMTEMTGSPVIEGVAITTNLNAAYEVIKQRRQRGRTEDDYEVMTGGSPADDNEKYDIPSPPAPYQLLPPPSVAPSTYSNMGVAGEAEGVYESIPGDNY